MNKYRETYKLFGKILVDDNKKGLVSFESMNEVAICRGLFVPEPLCYAWFKDYLEEECKIDYNSTIYKSWATVRETSETQHVMNQLKHYESTYGTDFQGEAWYPSDNTGEEKIDFPYFELTLVKSITESELIEKVKEIAYSSQAVSEDTLEFLASFKDNFELDKIGIRQLKIMLIDEKYQFKSGQECLSWLLYHFFDIDMLIKSTETLGRLGRMKITGGLYTCLKSNEVVLSQVFLRNKAIFLSIKGNQWVEANVKKEINRLRKLAIKNHRPMPKSPWLTLPEMDESERKALFEKASIMKLAQLWNSLSSPTGLYRIRNGKAWVKDGVERQTDTNILNEILEAIVSKVKKDVKVVLPEGINLAMPTSEKNFIGDLPQGSSVDLDKDSVFGIYWKNEWGAHDLDLHGKYLSGDMIGWNSVHNLENVAFSGDVTDAPNGGSELFWLRDNSDPFIASVNRYRAIEGMTTWKFEFVFSKRDFKKPEDFKKSYMLDPRKVLVKSEFVLPGVSSDVTLGYANSGKFIFHTCQIGKSNLVPTKTRERMLEHLVSEKFLDVATVLQLAGVEVITDIEKSQIDNPDIKVIDLSKKGEILQYFA